MHKRYTVKALQSMIDTFNSEGKKTVNLLEILTEIGFNKKDIKHLIMLCMLREKYLRSYVERHEKSYDPDSFIDYLLTSKL